MTRLLLLLAVALLSLRSEAAPILVNPLQRPGQSLDGKWAYIVDPYDNGYLDYRSQPFDRTDPPSGGYGLDRQPKDPSELIEYAFDDALTLDVPADWNSQDDKLFYYEGSVWYRRHFDAPQDREGKRYILYFGGANYRADVYLNGRKLGTHIGGFTPFQFEVTDRLQAQDNSLVVRVNNERLMEGVPTLNTDWWNYGGITRTVRLIEVPETYVADYTVRLQRTAADRIEARVELKGPEAGNHEVHLRLPELGIDQILTTGEGGVAQVSIPARDIERWSPQHPKLYDLEVATGAESVHERVGFRTIETRGSQILLNGEPIFLRGISIHETDPYRGGRAVTKDEAYQLLRWAQELGCNYARLAHYPHSEHMARLADEMGILLWEEIPVYWTIDWQNPDTFTNAQDQLTGLIERDKNRASVIIWSVANETPPTEARTEFLHKLVDHARELDDTRLVSAALEVHNNPDYPGYAVIDDAFGEFVDVVSFNQYNGWYGNRTPDDLEEVQWKVLYNKPVLISEFGGGALAGSHGDKHARFTEEYQAWLYEQTLPMLERIDGLSGMSPWILVDFRSPRRALPGIQDGWNRKGLIGDNGARKQAFYVLQDYYEQKATEDE
ncbi:MAG: beta-glucuronidase [Puniceicoccaceae bacterium 5H]|nr:MAG: beta-glucuronidase [Puniceicoccaceae bacterium 5H]